MYVFTIFKNDEGFPTSNVAETDDDKNWTNLSINIINIIISITLNIDILFLFFLFLLLYVSLIFLLTIKQYLAP